MKADKMVLHTCQGQLWGLASSPLTTRVMRGSMGGFPHPKAAEEIQNKTFTTTSLIIMLQDTKSKSPEHFCSGVQTSYR